MQTRISTLIQVYDYNSDINAFAFSILLFFNHLSWQARRTQVVSIETGLLLVFWC